jgi:MoxR-like ATPase
VTSPVERAPLAEDPAPHTAAELAAVLGLLPDPESQDSTALLSIGHSRDDASRAAARALADAWRRRGGTVLAVVDWPESAASWLRAAGRLTVPAPDAWAFAAAPVGFAQLARRLGQCATWDPARAVAFASLRQPSLPALAGADTLHGLRGATSAGGIWQVHHGRIPDPRAV